MVCCTVYDKAMYLKDSKIYDNVNNKIYYVKFKYDNKSKNKNRVASIDIEVENWNTKEKVYDDLPHYTREYMREHMREKYKDPVFVQKRNDLYNKSASYKCEICRKKIKCCKKKIHDISKKHTERYEMLKVTTEFLLHDN
jgi:hypothetical protein